jgi:hypothetical protein
MFSSFALLSGIALFSSIAAAVTHEVTIGSGLDFNPPFILVRRKSVIILKVELTAFQNATAGDIVSFTFTSNFSATQSTFDAPCTPLAGGLDTGLCVLSIQNFFELCFFDAFPHRIASTLQKTLMATYPQRNLI